MFIPYHELKALFPRDSSTYNSTAGNLNIESETVLAPESVATAKALLVTISIGVSLWFLVGVPHLYQRIRASPTIWKWPWTITSASPPPPLPKAGPRSLSSSSPLPPTDTSPATPYIPSRIPHLSTYLYLPIWNLPYLNLTLGQCILISALWVLGMVTAYAGIRYVEDSSRSGYVCLALMAVNVLFGFKFGGVGTWLSVGYAAINWIHRWIGRLIFLVAFFHVIAYTILFCQNHAFGVEMRKPANILGTIAFFALCLMTLFSIGPLRRRFYRLFKVIHHFAVVTFIIGMNYHSPSVLPYMVFMLILVFVNVLFRFLATRIHRATLNPLPGAATTLVTVPTLNTGWVAGQHVKIRVWTMESCMRWSGFVEAHPFTVASAENGEGLRLLVKVAGDWTSDLHQLAIDGFNERREIRQELDWRRAGLDGVDLEDEKQVTKRKQILEKRVWVSIEGPYGGPLKFLFPAFASVLLCAGGSGVSFALSVAEGLVRDVRARRAACQRVVLAWTVRDFANLQELFPLLQKLIDEAEQVHFERPDFTLHLELYHTGRAPARNRSSMEENLIEKGAINNGEELTLRGQGVTYAVNNRRPDFEVIARELANATGSVVTGGQVKGGGMAVGACGPHGMVQGIEKVCRKLNGEACARRAGGIEYYAEAFSL